MRWQSWAILLSVVVHGGIAAGIAAIPKDAGRKSSLVSVVEKKKKKDEKKDEPKEDEPPPPPPKPIEAPKPKPKPKAPPVESAPPPPAPTAPSPVAAAHPQLAALPDLGISLAGGPGGVGISVPVGPGVEPAATAAAAVRPEASAVKPKLLEGCTEPEVKPKSVPVAQGGIIAAAQSAGIEGRLKLELQIDESGNVTSARVITGLGGAIDEAALAAAKRVKVSPITKCGKPIAGRLTWGLRLRNPD
jgi:protein TonB